MILLYSGEEKHSKKTFKHQSKEIQTNSIRAE